MDNAAEVARLLKAKRSLVFVPTYEESYALETLRSAVVDEGLELLVWDAVNGLAEGLLAGSDSIPNTEHPAAALHMIAAQESAQVVCLLDLLDHLGDAKTLRALRNATEKFRLSEQTIVLIDHQSELPPAIRSSAVVFEPVLPDAEELEQIVRRTTQRLHREGPIELDLTQNDLRAIVQNLRGLNRRQTVSVIEDIVGDDRKLTTSDLEGVIQGKREIIQSGGMLEFVSSPHSLDEIGGLARLKTWLAHRERSLEKDDGIVDLDPPRGILLLGVQGAGKSMCAKAIATAWKRPLMRMDVSALYDKYIGESERRLRETLHQAEIMAPIILWIDEIEKAFAGAASRSNDGGLSRRMFGALLTWMQEHRAPVFLVATANDIEALPPELLRKGRFDEIFFVDLPQRDVRKRIFEIHLQKRGLDPSEFDLDHLAAESEGFSGAEIEQAVIAARHEAHSANKTPDTQLIAKTLGESPPLSVTMAERVEALRQWAKKRCMPAG